MLAQERGAYGLARLFLFIVLPVIEIYLFIEIGGALGTGWTIVLIFLTAAIGVSAMRRQGLAVLQEAQAAQHAGRPLWRPWRMGC